MVRKQTTGTSQTLSPDTVRRKAADDLYLIAASLRAEAETVSHGRPAHPRLLEIAGWAIYRAAQDGLLKGLVDLDAAVAPEIRQSLDDGVPLVIQNGADRAGPPVTADAKISVEQFIREVERREEAELAARRDASDEADRPPLHIALDPDEAARMLVLPVWRSLAGSRTEELPDSMKRLYLLGHGLQDLSLESSETMQKAAWVCRYLAENIAQPKLEPDTTGWLSLTEASKKISRDPGTLSRACNRGEIKDNGKKGRGRRLDPQSVASFGKRLDDNDRLKAFEAGADESTGAKYGWVCRNCQVRSPAGPRPISCPNCKKPVDFSPASHARR